jgi:hypothetical protein
MYILMPFLVSKSPAYMNIHAVNDPVNNDMNRKFIPVAISNLHH